MSSNLENELRTKAHECESKAAQQTDNPYAKSLYDGMAIAYENAANLAMIAELEGQL